MLNQNQVKDLVFATVALAKAAGRPGEVCFVEATGKWYAYVVAGSAYTANDDTVLTTGNGGDTRWVCTISNTQQFSTTPVVGSFSEGKLYYDSLWKTLSLNASRDSTLQIGQEDWRRVYNTGAKIFTGQAVYTTGVYSGGLPHVVTVALANASDSATAFVLGIATQDIDTNNYGFVTLRGNINGLKTDYAGWVPGDSLYLSDTSGELSNVKLGAPLLEIRVGRVIDVHATDGIINVRVSQAYQLDNLSDVAVSGVVANQILKFDGVSWIPADSATTASAGGTNFFLTDSNAVIEGLSRANPCIVTWTGHGLVDAGHQIRFEGITQAGWTALNTVSPAANLWHTVTIINENSFSIPVNTSGYAADYVPASDPGTYSLGKLIQTPDGTISESIDSTQSTGNVEALLDVYASPAALGRTTIEGGEWTFDTWCYASSTNDTNVIVIRVLKRSAAGSETELFNLTTADLGTTVTLSRIATIQPAFTILATDHLVVRYFAKSSRGVGLYRQIYLVHGGTTHYSLFKTPLAVAHNQLGGLNTSGYRHLPAAVADSDFAVGQASDGNWIKKTLAEAKIILGSTGTNTGDQTGGTPALTLGTANTAGSSTNFIRRDDTILAFDATNPAAIGTAGPGSATVAARRDHVHSNTSVALITPVLGTPTSGILTNCTSDTEADNNSTTQLATTAFAKSQDAVLARLPNQAVNMTGTATTGIVVADSPHINNGTDNHTLTLLVMVPDWTPAVALSLLNKYNSGTSNGPAISLNTNGTIALSVAGTDRISTVAPPHIDGCFHFITVVVKRETASIAGYVAFYSDGVHFGTDVVLAAGVPGTQTNVSNLSLLGYPGTSFAGAIKFASMYNRALTAAEVLDLYRNGIAYADMWGSQTAVYNETAWTGATGATYPTGWSLAQSGTFTIFDSGDGAPYNVCLKIADNGTDRIPAIYKDFTVVIGKKYRVTLWFKHGTGTSGRFVIGSTTAGAEYVATVYPIDATWTKYSYEITATTTIISVYIRSVTTASGQYELYDEISVYEIGAILALEPEGIQNNLWYDSSSNALNASYPAAGWSLTRKLNMPRTNTAQPAFLAKITSDISNITGDGTEYTISGALFTEIYDQSNSFSNGSFVAPVAGKYKFGGFLCLGGITSSHTSCSYRLYTIARSVYQSINPYALFDATNGVAMINLSFPDMIMAANDSAYFLVTVSNGTKVVDILDWSYFSCHLVC